MMTRDPRSRMTPPEMSLAAGTTQLCGAEPADGPHRRARQADPSSVADFREVPCLLRPRSHPGASQVRGRAAAGARAGGYPDRRCPTRTRCGCAPSPTQPRPTTTSCYHLRPGPRPRPATPPPRPASLTRRPGSQCPGGQCPGGQCAGGQCPGGQCAGGQTSPAITRPRRHPPAGFPQGMAAGQASSPRCWWRPWPDPGRPGR
jgi:hypothetical protein